MHVLTAGSWRACQKEKNKCIKKKKKKSPSENNNPSRNGWGCDRKQFTLSKWNDQRMQNCCHLGNRVEAREVREILSSSLMEVIMTFIFIMACQVCEQALVCFLRVMVKKKGDRNQGLQGGINHHALPFSPTLWRMELLCKWWFLRLCCRS